jgi:hypothetical protein
MSNEILLISLLWFLSDVILSVSFIFPSITKNFESQKWLSFTVIALRCLLGTAISSIKNIYDSFVKD